ncbi:MAG: uroporphyrinogen-III synthase [Rhizobiaceae bacterium]|nr:uroporphyrinogen-III synthase [Rhizobiaceae bacterium]
MVRVLILRPRAEAEETALAAVARGHEPSILPLHEIVPHDAAPPGRDVSGFVATSAHALPALAAAFGGDDRPLLAVGSRTARLAADLGFPRVVEGDGSGESLLAPASRVFSADGRPLLYAAGRVRTPALEEALYSGAVAVLVWEVYDTRPLDLMPQTVLHALLEPAPEAVMLLSVGQAEAYGQLLARMPPGTAPEPRLLCLSARIAAALPAALSGRIEISDEASMAALFDLLR